MMKGRRVASMESSPSSSSYVNAGEDARARFKYRGLLQDYEELVTETEATKKRLQLTKRKKLRLLAEIKFLRGKYKSLSQTPSQPTPYRLKKRCWKMPSTSLRISRPLNAIVQRGIPLKDRDHRAMDAAVPSTSAMIDLNQISLPNGEDMEEFHLKRCCSIDGQGRANDLNLSVCRDVGSTKNRVGKRKLSWQDQVALKV